MAKRRICLTPGDPTGVGPEITVRFLQNHIQKYADVSFDVIGDIKSLEEAAQFLNIVLPQSDAITYTNIEANLPGAVCYEALVNAVEKIAKKQSDALVTGPIAKSHLKEAGLEAQGHTEILEALAKQYFPNQPAKAEMLFVYKNFRLMLLTRHIALSEVGKSLSKENIMASFDVLTSFLKNQLNIETPQIALLGVNPHAGEIVESEKSEEAQVLIPAIYDFNAANNILIQGPFPADAFFRGFNLNHLPYDAVIATYHDQGLIPFKLIAGFEAVNVTIGLPFVRTSVSHGTAFDIAGTGQASEASLIAAVDLAVDMIPVTQAALT